MKLSDAMEVQNMLMGNTAENATRFAESANKLNYMISRFKI